MNSQKKSNELDVVMVYQDRDNVDLAIEQIMELNLNFKAFKYHPNKTQQLLDLRPKVLLLSSNDVKKTIELYINYLEGYEKNIAAHSSILLINNRESYNAYLACENGLFNNYVIINPLNEPYRLKLILLQELKIIQNHENNSLNNLISKGEEQLASCIEHGVALRNSFSEEINKLENNVKETLNENIQEMDTKKIIENIIGVNLEEMNENVSAKIEKILNQIDYLKTHNQSIKKKNSHDNTEIKSDIIQENNNNDNKYKVLIAEPSNLFTVVIEEIFSNTEFECIVVNNGNSALSQIEQFKPDVALLAYDLPNLNGIEITKKIRKAGNNLPIIAYTHARDKKVIKKWIPLGLSEYLIKPSKKSILLQSVRNAVNKQSIIIPNDIGENTEIKWIDKFSVGNTDIDDQHKVLFELINSFFQEENEELVINIFESLKEYIELHFDSEENLLRQINYPKTDEHIEKHNALRKKFNNLSEKLENYNIDLHHKIGLFLYHWLANHILKSDMDYKKYAISIEEPSFKE